MFGNYAIPKDGFAGTGGPNAFVQKAVDSTHNVVSTSDYAKQYPLGTTIGYYNDTLNGYGACMYVRFNVTGSESVAIKAGSPCGRSADADIYYDVTPDQSAASDDGGFGIALSSMTNNYYGWLWIWGVCPDFYTSATAKYDDSVITTDGNIVAGASFTMEFSTADNKIILGVDAEAAGTAKLTRMGFSIAADSATPDIAVSKLFLYNTWQ